MSIQTRTLRGTMDVISKQNYSTEIGQGPVLPVLVAIIPSLFVFE